MWINLRLRWVFLFSKRRGVENKHHDYKCSKKLHISLHSLSTPTENNIQHIFINYVFDSPMSLLSPILLMNDLQIKMVTIATVTNARTFTL